MSELAESGEHIVERAMRSIEAGNEALRMLREIGAGTARPDALAECLIELLTDAGNARRSDIVKGFLRPVAKCIETSLARAKTVAGTK
ncbi:hypothetical protein F3J20_16110 [Paraburkholderia sp. Cy-641]|uniref:hypothetical protein n=1 Tax=Paraburkholderia sp. Cy-641 TaxID=2608337 RepID=UPI001421F1A6|nr:hypothetical protein [Paraburkholderia sp. Cy-641]NIF78892.1 hypothetical protein [Paraburkholderia sp. Cy-641]